MDLEKIWFEYHTSLKAFLYKNVANKDDVEDLLQDIMIKTFDSLNTIKESKKMKSWLFQVANNTIIDFYRQRAKRIDIAEEQLWYQDSDENVLQQLSSCVTPFIQNLPEPERKLLYAIEIEGISQKEYAQSTGIKYSTLKSRVKKSREMLYSLFSDCCELSIDHKGRLMDYQEKGNKNCDC